MSNLQHIFTTVVLHARKQRAKSLTYTKNVRQGLGDVTCAYRSPEGLSCFVGCLIRDEFYSPELENKLSYDESVVDALIKSGVMEEDSYEDRSPLEELQMIHDSFQIDEWERKFIRFAITYSLSIPEATKELPLLPMSIL